MEKLIGTTSGPNPRESIKIDTTLIESRKLTKVVKF